MSIQLKIAYILRKLGCRVKYSEKKLAMVKRNELQQRNETYRLLGRRWFQKQTYILLIGLFLF